MTDHDTIKSKLSEKETDALLSIWNDNNRDQWTDEAFAAIHQILTERNITVPSQPPPPPQEPSHNPDVKIGAGTILAMVLGETLAKHMPDTPVMRVVSAALVGCTIGFLLGLIPYFIANAKGHANLGRVAFVACILAGLAFNMYASVPLCVIFTIVALSKKTRKDNPAEQMH